MSDVQKIIADTMALHFLERNLRIHETERTEWWECVGCGWESERFDLNDSEVEAEIHWVKRAHVATAIDTALGGLAEETAHRFQHKESGRFSILTEPGDVRAARQIAGADGSHELTEVSRYTTSWLPQ